MAVQLTCQSPGLHPDLSTQTLAAAGQGPNSSGHIVVTALPSSSWRYKDLPPRPTDTPKASGSFATQSTHPSSRQTPSQPRQRALSSFMSRIPRSSTMSLIATLQIPSILAVYISHLDWVDTYPLLVTCRTTYNVLRNDDLKDTLLSRYVPGYAKALQEHHLDHAQRIPISIHDLDLLLMSQRVPLHRYPMHSLRVQTSLYPTFRDDEQTRKFVALSQAHSRFVLLLQSLVHSSLHPIPSEPSEANIRPRFAPVKNLRELTFPPPLAYERQFLPDPPVEPAGADLRLGHKHSRYLSASGTKGYGVIGSPSFHSDKNSQIARGPQSSAKTISSTTGPKSQHWTPSFHKRRLSLFGNTYVAPPPPKEPHALKIYGDSWRRGSTAFHHRRNTVDVDENGYAQPLQRPLRRFASANNSSDSSISDVAVGRDTRDSSRNSLTGLPSTSSPHDLLLATSRVRAPVLRTFVPCAQLEDCDQFVVECERQLDEAGLWPYLSTGDIVCNLGYVPPSVEDSSSEDISPGSRHALNAILPKPAAAAGRPSSSSSSLRRKWLIFNGEALIPYTPPDILPLDQCLSLPSPLYYSHIMPASANPVYVIPQLPVCDDVPQFRLVHSTSKVPSPHSPEGFALVKKYSWTARVVRLRMGDEGDIGDGWFGEWILEYDGTEEGKQTLLHALNGRRLGQRCWEVLRDKSGGGKIWLRLLPIS